MNEESPEALVEPKSLVWARVRAKLDLAVAAKTVGVSQSTLAQWELGLKKPTMKQARKLAAAYRQALPVLFLETPPPSPPVRVHDRRSLPEGRGIAAALLLDIERSVERRAIAIELSTTSSAPLSVPSRARSDPDKLGAAVRRELSIDVGMKDEPVDTRIAMNTWREALERRGVLVFQSSAFELEDARGYSIWFETLPVIVLNRRDAYAGRTFTLLHEATHLALRTDGICDLDESGPVSDVEVFCNRAAGAALVPETLLRRAVGAARGPSWSNAQLERLANRFGVSRQTILRRLLIADLTTDEFYERKQKDLLKEVPGPRRDGFPPPVVDVLSKVGKPFARQVLAAMDVGAITDVDASSYLELKQKHFAQLRVSTA